MNDSIETGTDVVLKGKEFDEVSALLAGEPDVKITVHKKPEEGGKWAHCFSFKPGEYDEGELLDTITAEYGPGDYPVVFKSPDDDGRQVIRWNRHMTVQRKRLSAQAATPTPAATSSTDALLINAIENNTRILQGVVDKLATPPPAEPRPTMADFGKELLVFKELFAPADKTSPTAAAKELLEVFTMMQGAMGNQGGGDDLFTTAAKAFLPAIAQGTQELKNREVTRPANTPEPDPTRETVAPQPVVETPTGQTPSPETSEAILVDQAYAVFTANFLMPALQLADQNQKPKEVADYLNNFIGTNPQAIDMLGRVIAEDNMVERFGAVNGAALDHAAWFDEVADWLAHAHWPDANPAPGAENATFDATSDEKREIDGINAANGNGKQPPGQGDAKLVDDDADTDPPGPKGLHET